MLNRNDSNWKLTLFTWWFADKFTSGVSERSAHAQSHDSFLSGRVSTEQDCLGKEGGRRKHSNPGGTASGQVYKMWCGNSTLYTRNVHTRAHACTHARTHAHTHTRFSILFLCKNNCYNNIFVKSNSLFVFFKIFLDFCAFILDRTAEENNRKWGRGMTCCKGPQDGIEPGRCVAGTASVHGASALPTKLSGHPRYVFLTLSQSSCIFSSNQYFQISETSED